MSDKQRERVRLRKGGTKKGGAYVLYWMQASARTEYNHALEYAVHLANSQELPLLVCFGITEGFPEAQIRHYWFMIEGLKGVAESLDARGIPFLPILGEPDTVASGLAEAAAALVLDTGYLRIQRRWRDSVVEVVECPVYQVESEVVVPVQVASEKEEYTAATLRPKINRHLHRFLKPVPPLPVKRRADHPPREAEESLNRRGLRRFDLQAASSPEEVEKTLPKVRSEVRPVTGFLGGTGEAKRRLQEFLSEGIAAYDEARNDPARDGQSGLSPYLHFGQISPVFVAVEAQEAGGDGVGAFLEELIVRRELSMNFCHYNPEYDSYDSLPEWARKSLSEHLGDSRPEQYDLKTLEAGRTADPYWNAAQIEMVRSGKMHGYMRMYWGKLFF